MTWASSFGPEEVNHDPGKSAAHIMVRIWKLHSEDASYIRSCIITNSTLPMTERECGLGSNH